MGVGTRVAGGGVGGAGVLVGGMGVGDGVGAAGSDVGEAGAVGVGMAVASGWVVAVGAGTEVDGTAQPLRMTRESKTLRRRAAAFELDSF